MATEQLKITIDVDVKDAGQVKGLRAELADLGKAGKSAAPGLDATTKSSAGMAGAIKGLVAGGLVAAAGQQLIAFGKASITAASDVQEMSSKFDTVFKDLSGSVTQELQAFADASNRSVYDLKGFAATLQDTFVPLGFARDQAADMSVELVKLAEDLASFNNLNTDEVVRDLQSALVGNTETLRKYGVVAQETQIKQEALATGLWDGKGAIDAQAKAQAILQLALKGTTDAQGDAVKTADSYANQTKGLKAAMTDLQVTVGNALLPAMTALVQIATEAADRLTVAAGVAGEYGSQVEGIIDGNIEAAKSFDDLVAEGQKIADVGDMWGGLASAITGTEKEIIEGSRSTAAAMATQADSFEQFSAGLDEAFGNSRIRSLFDVYLQQLGLSEQGFYEMARAQAEAAAVASEAAAADAVLTQSLNAGTAATEARTLAAIEYSAAAAAAAGVNENLADKTAQLAHHTGTEEQAAAAANLANAQYFRTLEAGAAVTDAAAQAQAELAQKTAAYFQEAIKSEGAIGLFNETAAQMADRSIYVSNLTGAQRDVLADLQSEYEKAQGVIDDYTMGVKGIGLTTEEVNEKVTEQQERMAELQAAMDPLISAGGEYANVQGTMTINEKALNQAIYDSAEAQGASAEQLAILGGALGLYSEEAVDAALKTAAIQIKIDELAQAYVNGSIGVDEMRQGIQDFIAELNGVPATVVTDVQVTGLDEAIAKAGTLQEQLNGLGNQLTPAEAAGAGQKEGGGVYAASGADFVVPPGYPNDSFGPIWAQSGEQVQITPAGQTTNNSNSVNLVQNFFGGGQQAMSDARNGTMQALKEAGITGFG